MHRTAASDRWKALKMSARKLARDARLETQRLQGRETTLAEAKALRLGDMTMWEKEISVKENRKVSCTYRMAGASATGRGRQQVAQENRRRGGQAEGQAMKVKA